MGCLQLGGDTLVIDLGHAALYLGRVSDVTVIGNAATLLGCVVVVVEECLQLVAVTHVRPEQAPGEVLVGLHVIGALRVDVVNAAAHLGLAVHVARELQLRTVQVTVLVAAGRVAEQGHGDARVVEAHRARVVHPCPDGVLKEEVARHRAFKEDLVLSRRPVVTRGQPRIAHHRGHHRAVVIQVDSVDGRGVMQTQRFAHTPCE